MVRDQEVEGLNPFAPATVAGVRPFKINAVRCVLDRDFPLIFADNTDSIRDFAWKFEARI